MEAGVNEELEEVVEKEEAAEAVEGSEATEPAAAQEPQDPIAALEAEVQKYKEEALRRAAELDNYRKRMSKELEESRKFSNQRLLSELLPVLDNFGMGMQMAEKEQGSMLYQGMAMVQGQLAEFFTGQGVTLVEIAPGSDFDPNFHEAIGQEPSTEVEEGKILGIVRNGFMVSGRLLRAANVIVAKAPEAEGANEEEEGK